MGDNHELRTTAADAWLTGSATVRCVALWCRPAHLGFDERVDGLLVGGAVVFCAAIIANAISRRSR
jgi:hypothetical protein